MIRIIVAFDEKRGIGYQGKIPWRIPADMQHFRQTTTGHAVIMGRVTWESLTRPLPNRRNIVVSNTLPSLRGVEVVHSLQEAFKVTDNDAFVIGGASLYKAALPFTQLIIASHVQGVHPADTFFPVLDLSKWMAIFVKRYDAFDVWTYERSEADDRQYA